MIRKRTLLPAAALLCLAVGAFAQDAAPVEQPSETKADAAEPAPAGLEFGDDLEAARERARAEKKPLLIVAVPDWYESPGWTRLRDETLASEDARQLEAFVRVRVRESRDREVHVRHRLRYGGYPLAVVLAPTGGYLGHVSGLPASTAPTGWVERVAAIPARSQRMTELRTALEDTPEEPGVLFELAGLHVEAGETERAVALYERMERADPLGPPERLAEARYQRLRHAAVKALEAKKFGDVEAHCRKWLRRFAEHDRAPEVLLLQANARFLAGDADGAREVWDALIEKHADSDAAKRAGECKQKLAK